MGSKNSKQSQQEIEIHKEEAKNDHDDHSKKKNNNQDVILKLEQDDTINFVIPREYMILSKYMMTSCTSALSNQRIIFMFHFSRFQLQTLHGYLTNHAGIVSPSPMTNEVISYSQDFEEIQLHPYDYKLICLTDIDIRQIYDLALDLQIDPLIRLIELKITSKFLAILQTFLSILESIRIDHLDSGSRLSTHVSQSIEENEIKTHYFKFIIEFLLFWKRNKSLSQEDMKNHILSYVDIHRRDYLNSIIQNIYNGQNQTNAAEDNNYNSVDNDIDDAKFQRILLNDIQIRKDNDKDKDSKSIPIPNLIINSIKDQTIQNNGGEKTITENEDNKTCIVCNIMERRIAAIPCGHIQLCRGCLNNYIQTFTNKCGICRGKVSQWISVI